jgi:hypothetical protein
MRYLRTNTAVRVTVGPFLDKTDGVTPEVAITVTSCKLTFMVDDANVPTLVLDTAPTASGGANDMVHVTGDDSGFYDLELAAANVNYLGRAMLSINDAATHCPVFHEFMILPAVVYDAMVLGTDNFDVSVTQWTGTNVASPDTAGYPKVTHKTGTGTGELDITSGVVKGNLVQILGTALTETAGQIAAAFKQFFDVGTPTGTMKAITNVVTATNLTNAPTNGDLTATMKASVNTEADTALSDYGGLKPTVGGRTLDVSATGEAGVDWANVGTPGSTVNLSATTVKTLTDAPSDSSGVTTLLSRLSSARAGYLDNLSAGAVSLASTFSGITNLAQWLGLLAGKQTGNSTARTEVRATGGGSGTFDETTDSQEAIRDRGDSAWTTAVGFATHSAADVWAVATRLLTAGTNIVLAKGTGVTGFNDLSAAQVNAEADTALADAGVTTTVTGRIDAAISTRASQTSVDTIDDFVDTEVAAIKAKTDNLPAAPAAVGDIPTAVQNADALLGRNLAGGSSTGRTVKQALRALRNKVTIVAGTATVYEEDDTTASWTAAITTDDTAEPIVEVDPA